MAALRCSWCVQADLFVKRRLRTCLKRILVPLDGSKTAESALPYARTLAERLDADVELLEVIDVGEI
jgi:hypothetical protein